MMIVRMKRGLENEFKFIIQIFFYFKKLFVKFHAQTNEISMRMDLKQIYMLQRKRSKSV